MATNPDTVEDLGDFIEDNLDELSTPLDGEQADPEKELQSEETPIEQPDEAEQSDAEPVEDDNEEEVVEVEEPPELAETLEGLAEQIEVDADDLKALTVTIEVDGESRSVTIGEALAQMGQSDTVTRQSEQLAESQRNHNHQVEQATAMWQDRLQRIDAVVTAIEAEIEEGPDLNLMLAEGDTEGYLLEKAKIEQKGQKLHDVKTARYQAGEEDRSQKEREFNQRRAERGTLLLKAYPELNDPVKAQEFDRAIESDLAKLGAPPGFASQWMQGADFDVWQVKAMKIAAAALTAKDKQPALRRKLKALKPVARTPRAARGATEVSQDKSNAIKARVRKTGGRDPDIVAEMFNSVI